MWPDGSQYIDYLTSGDAKAPAQLPEGVSSGWSGIFVEYLGDTEPQMIEFYGAYSEALEAGEGAGLQEAESLLESITQFASNWGDVVQRVLDDASALERGDVEPEQFVAAVRDDLAVILELWWVNFADTVDSVALQGLRQYQESEAPESQQATWGDDDAITGDMVDQLVDDLGRDSVPMPQEEEEDEQEEHDGLQDAPGRRDEPQVDPQAELRRTHPFPPTENARDWITQQSQAELKDAQDVGTQLPVIQIGDILLIGNLWASDQGKVPYRESALLHGGVEGVIEVRSRGTAFSTGKIRVSGALDRDRFKRSLREFSKKDIEWA